MATSITSGIKSTIGIKIRRLFTLLSLIIISLSDVLGQAPTWVAGTPSIPSTGALSISVNYGINMVGTVYITVVNYDYSPIPTSAQVKAGALAGPAGGRVATAVLPVTAGNINLVLNTVLDVINVNTVHSVFIVAENGSGVLQAVPIKLLCTTKPCPDIQIFTFFGNVGECVNLGATGMFQAAPLGVLPTGVLKGTKWTIDWGDGTALWQYTSAADDDLPGVQLHNYTNLTTCNFVGTWTVQNPCGKFANASNVFVVHGRDIPADGDGLLRMEEVTTHTPDIVYVCEGHQHDLTIADISTWNCQNPVVPFPLTAKPNIDPRTLQFTYGQTPAGAVMNTITGDVLIAGTHIANGVGGWDGPVITPVPPPNPNTQTDVITIPATCQVGERFYIYIKNWNKCNPYASNPAIGYEYTQFIIEVIDAPPPPIVTTPQNYCFGAVPATISATPNLPGNTINWYADALLTTFLYTGQNYTHGKTLVGTYNYWVTETSGVNGCEGPPAQITMNIREALPQPGAITGPAQVCSNQAGVIFSVAANPPTMPIGGTSQYIWTVPGGWTITAGQGTRQITVTVDATAGIQTVSLVNQYTTVPNCPSPSQSTTTLVNPIATINSANSKTVCNNTPLAYTATSATPSCTFAWTRAVVPGISNGAGAGATALINESLINTTTATVNAIYVITPTINGCTGTPFNLTVTVNPTAVITSANSKTVCNTTPLGYTATSSTGGATFAWTRAVVPGISNGAGAGATALINESLNNTTTAPVNAIYVITPSYGGCAGTPFNLTVTVNPKAVITSSATANVCDNVPLGYTATSSTVGATFAWTRAVVGGIANGAGAGATAFINESLDNTVTSPVAVTYVITPSYGGCAGTPFNLVVTVNPTSVITSANSKTVCNNTPLGYTATSSTPGASFSWTRAVVPGISNGAGAGATALINESLINTTTSTKVAVYVITPSINGCAGTAFNLSVTVNPTAVITSAATKTVCDITALGYTATSSTAGATFAWTRAVVPGIANGAGSGLTALINETLDNTTTAPVNVTYTIAASYGGCAGTPFTLTVTVNPTATINSAATKNICNVTPLGYTATSATAGATFAWTRAVVPGITNGAGAGATALINESLNNNTTAPVNVTYVITPGYGGCAGTPFNLVVTVNPTSVITSANSKTVCSNEPLAYTATSSTVGASFSWTRAVVPGISNGAGAGATALINESLINTTGANVNAIYVITPSINGCNGTPFNLTVTVHPQFTLAQLHDNASICNNTATNINVAMSGGTSPFTVNYTKNAIAQAPWVGYVSSTNMTTGALVANTTYVLTSVTDNYGCPAQSLGTSILITVGSSPTTATLAGSGDACSGASSWIKSVISGGAPPYTINYTRNAVVQAPITPYNSNTNFDLGILPVGSYTYAITSVQDLCGNLVPGGGLPLPVTININAIPNAAATVNNTASICNNGTTDIVLHANVANSDFIYTFTTVPAVVSWQGGKAPLGGTRINGENTSIAQNLAHNENAPVTVTYTITPRGPGATACPGTPITRSVVVNPTSVITSAATKTVCNTTPLAYTATSSTVGASFSWTRAVVVGISNGAGAGATALINESLTNTTIAPVNAIYIITPSINGCNGTPFTLTVTVNPTAVITSSATANVCDNVPLGYTATSSTVGATFAWTRAVVVGIANGAGAGATSSINESLDNTTTAPVAVTYIITPSYAGCPGTPFNLVVTVNPTSVITSAATKTVCNTTPLAYIATSSTPGASFSWTRAVVVGISNGAGAGATALINESLTNTTIAPVNAIYIITPSINGCNGTPFTLTVTVNPTAVITSSATANVCDNVPLGYTATSSTVGATFAWTRAVVVGIANGAGAGATSSINESLDNTITAPVAVTYIITPSYAGCAGTPFNLVVTVNPTSVITSAATKTVCNTTPLAYTATSSTPGASFSWTRAVVVGISNGAGAGATALINESLTNTTIAPVNAIYIITPSINGCNGTPFTLTVTVNPTAVITSSATANVCDNVPLGYTATSSTVGATFAWTRAVVVGIANGAGAGATSSINESLDNTTTAPVAVTYIITPSYAGCAGTPFNLVVTVNPTSVITSAATKTVCNTTPLAYTATSSTPGASFSWTRAVVVGISNVAGAGATALINESLTNTTIAPVNAVYIITPSINGCNGTPFTLTVTVNPTAVITSSATANVCDNVPLGYTATSSTVGATFAWTRAVVVGIANGAGAGATSSINESLDNTTTAPVAVTYIITPSYAGCAGTPFNLVVTVNPTPVLSSSLTPADVCSNTAFSYNPTSATAGTSFTWTRAVVAGITPAGPTAGPNNPNETLVNITSAPIAVTYQYTLTANGCSNVQNVVVNIKPEPVITPGQNTPSCSGNALNYRILMNNFTNPADGVLFSWSAPVLAPISPNFTGGTARAVPTAANITDTFINTMGVLGTATYTVTPFKNGCAGTPVTVVFTIGAQPVLDPGLNAFACSNVAIGLTLKVTATSVPPTYYNIISKTVDAGLTDVGNAAIPNPTAAAAYLSTDKYS